MHAPMIYLAAPYWDDDPAVREWRVWQVSALGDYLSHQGFFAYSPLTYGHAMEQYARAALSPIGEPYWREHSMRMLAYARFLLVLMLPGWEESKGIKNERAWAFDHDDSIETYTIAPVWCTPLRAFMRRNEIDVISTMNQPIGRVLLAEAQRG